MNIISISFLIMLIAHVAIGHAFEPIIVRHEYPLSTSEKLVVVTKRYDLIYEEDGN